MPLLAARSTLSRFICNFCPFGETRPIDPRNSPSRHFPNSWFHDTSREISVFFISSRNNHHFAPFPLVFPLFFHFVSSEITIFSFPFPSFFFWKDTDQEFQSFSFLYTIQINYSWEIIFVLFSSLKDNSISSLIQEIKSKILYIIRAHTYSLSLFFYNTEAYRI